MGNAVIPRRQGGSYTKIEFENCEVKTLEKREVENLSKARYEFAAASVGDYALFGGGHYSSDVDAYSMNLTHSTPTALNEEREHLAATAGQSYALFGGGERYNSTETDYCPNVDAYNADLVHSNAADLSEGRSYLAATTVGNYSLFAGGQFKGIYVDAGGNSLLGTYSSDKVDVYDDNLAQTTATALSLDRASLVATTVGEYAIFASGTKWSGSGGTGVRKVDMYSTSLVHSTLADTTNTSFYAATSVGDYALFAGSPLVDVYNISLVKLTPVNLSGKSYGFVATTVANFALFGGGKSYNSHDAVSEIEGFDNNLILHRFENLGEAKAGLAATALKNYALFGGGYFYDSLYLKHSATVDCYEYTSKDLELTLYKGTRYKFQDMDAEVTVEADIETKTIATPTTGYIKLKKVTLS